CCRISYFFFSCYGDPRALHSFPTRRSSDLCREHYSRRGEVNPDRGRGALGRDLWCGAEGKHHRQSNRFYCHVWVSTRLISVCSRDRKSTRLNSSHVAISYAVFCLKKKNQNK